MIWKRARSSFHLRSVKADAGLLDNLNLHSTVINRDKGDVFMNSEEAKIRMMEGRLYPPTDEAIMKEQALCMEKLYDFNATRPL